MNSIEVAAGLCGGRGITAPVPPEKASSKSLGRDDGSGGDEAKKGVVASPPEPELPSKAIRKPICGM